MEDSKGKAQMVAKSVNVTDTIKFIQKMAMDLAEIVKHVSKSSRNPVAGDQECPFLDVKFCMRDGLDVN